jgi:CheY-like chemotaxis protein
MNINVLRTRGRILLVEDDPEAALFAVTVLAKRGQFTVTHTADPAVALQLVAAERWDLVFTDVEMPGMNGLELLDALRRIAPALPVVVVSSHTDLRTAALLRHADEFLTKPVRIDQLLATAADLIDRAARRQEQGYRPVGPGCRRGGGHDTLRGTPGADQP